MRPKNSYTPVIITTVLLMATAIFGYSIADPDPQMPVRILFKNNGGKVIFSHLVHHRDYQIDCADCHHDRETMKVRENDDAMACGSCHPVDFDQQYIDNHMDSFPDDSYCVRCHHVEYGAVIFDHDLHADEYASDCIDCHHDKEIEPEPQKCSNCHLIDGKNELLSMRLAGHQSCGNCHEDMFDQGLSSCKSCHERVDMTQYDGDYTSCGSCHEKDTRELVLPRMNAFHDQCMDCHIERGAGPAGDDSCNKCHIR